MCIRVSSRPRREVRPVLAGGARGRQASRGSSMVEAALVSLTFALVLIGILDCGQFLFIHQALVERARNAARWGAVNNPTDTASIQNMVLYNQASVPPPPASGYFGLTTAMVQVSTADPSTDNYRLVVQITNYPYRVFSPLIAGTYTGPNITISVPLGLTS